MAANLPALRGMEGVAGRVYFAAIAMASVAAGRIMRSSVTAPPAMGKSPSFRPNTYSRISPTQKLGIDTPKKDSPRIR